MTQAQWTAVDDYINGLLIPVDPVLDAALKAAEDAKLPPAQVAPNQGKLLAILAQSIRAKSILEVGTLGGYSTIWLARALPAGGKLITLEVDPKHADVARANFKLANLSDVIDLRLGAAVDTLPSIANEGHSFDFVFIDADKANNTNYFNWALKLTHSGSMIIVDNVIRDGKVIDADSTDPSVVGVRQFNAALAAETRVTATQLQTVGSKGYDGFAMALVL